MSWIAICFPGGYHERGLKLWLLWTECRLLNWQNRKNLILSWWIWVYRFYRLNLLGGYLTYEHKDSILFVDYVENNREILTRHLYGQGHSVMMAEDSRQVLEMIRQSLILRNAAGAGWTMPGMMRFGIGVVLSCRGGLYPTILPMTLQIRCINLLLKPGKENLV